MPINNSLIEDSLGAMRLAIGDPPASLHEPHFAGNEYSYIKECLDSTFVSSVGRFVDRFEAELANFCEVDFAVVVNNGTSALHMALNSIGVSTGDEVLCPSLTFVATANAISHCGAVPHFVESDEITYGIDPIKLLEYLKKTTKKKNNTTINKITGRSIKAIVPVHVFGHPCQIDALLEVAREFNLMVIEDAAESIGSLYKGRSTGSFGLLGIVSFNGNKTITTGGGGAVLTNDRDLATHIKHITTTAKVPHDWRFIHDALGYNFRMPNLNAALGCAQLELLPAIIIRKRRLFEIYNSYFSRIPGLSVLKEPNGCSSNYWLQTLVLDREHTIFQRDLLETLNKAGFMSRPPWDLLHTLNPYLGHPRMETPIAMSLSKRLVNIPSSPALVGDKSHA